MTETRDTTRHLAEVDLDHRSPEFREDPYGTFRKMPESGCPVAHSDHYEGFWALTDYATLGQFSPGSAEKAREMAVEMTHARRLRSKVGAGAV